MLKKIIFIILFVLVLTQSASLAEDYYNLAGCIHVNSNVGKGRYSLEEIIGLARSNGIQIVILGDILTSRVEYGIWPLRNILKVFDDSSSLLNYGVSKYLNKIKSFTNDISDIIIMPGIEVAPFYYWAGTLLKRDLVLHDPSKHMFIAGLDKPSDLLGMPVIGNHNAGKYGLISIILAWPLLVMGIGVYLFFKIPVKKERRTVGIIFLSLGVIFFINNFPFKKAMFDAYSIKNRIFYYQQLIDYVNKKGGVVFWLQPCGESGGVYKGVKYETLPFTEDLFYTQGYTGFSVFYEGEEMVKPMGPWDKLLLEYCLGKRNRPVWAIGDMDYSYEEENHKNFGEVQTVFLVKDKTKEAVVRALKNGNMYAYYSRDLKNQLRLDKFEVRDRLTGSSAIMGQEVSCFSPAEIAINISGPEAIRGGSSLRLIRNGMVIQVFQIKNLPFNTVFIDDYFVSREKCYYRLEVEGIVANPVFVTFKDLK
ncbi:MAG: hypothetical protein NTZ63_02410 [Candidatus Omnitrophica bacterium]|nr:hypothetical protein [Candidatus Omnitrophota bacterium]